MRRLLGLFAELGAAPHRLTDGEGDEGQGAYAAIVREKMHELAPFIWIKASKGLPVRRYAVWSQTETVHAASIRRSRPAPEARGKLRASYSAQKAAARKTI